MTPRRRGPLPRTLAVLATAATLVALAGCAPLDQKRVLADVTRSVEAADPDLAGVAVEKGTDGFASVLSVTVAIPDDTIDADRVRAVIKAAVDTRGADGFTTLSFGVLTPDLHGDLVDLRPALQQLGLRADSEDLRDDVSTIKKAVG